MEYSTLVYTLIYYHIKNIAQIGEGLQRLQIKVNPVNLIFHTALIVYILAICDATVWLKLILTYKMSALNILPYLVESVFVHTYYFIMSNKIMAAISRKRAMIQQG